MMRGLGLRGHDVNMIGMNRVQEAMSVVWELPGDRIVEAEGKVDLTEFGGKRLYKIYPHGIHGDANNPRDVESSTKGAKMLELMLTQYNPDCFITLQDTQTVIWMAQVASGTGIPWFHWVPWDNIKWEFDMSRVIMEGQMNAVFMSDFAEKLARDNKVPYRGKIYHGVNTRIYSPISDSKNNIRNEIGQGMFKDKFVVSYIGQNEERKHLDILVKCFKEFAKGKEDVRLFMHTDTSEPYPAHWSYNIVPMVQTEDIDEKFKCTSRFNWVAKYSERAMCKLYNAPDILASTTSGEGFGLGTLYGNACGTPTAITDSCTSPQLTGNGEWGWLSKATAEYVAPGGYTRKMTNAEEMTKCLNEAYNSRDLLKRKGERARRDVVENYDSDIVGKQWADLLEGFFQKRGRN
jgi:glycosyltransferase involved in cell wall biosynthesis